MAREDATDAAMGMDALLEPKYQEALVDDAIVTPAPGWVFAVGGAAGTVLLLTCFLLFWLGMGTAPRESAVEAFGVVFGLLVIVSGTGAFVQQTRDERP